MPTENNEITQETMIFCQECDYKWKLYELDKFINSEGNIICSCPNCTGSVFGYEKYREEVSED